MDTSEDSYRFSHREALDWLDEMRKYPSLEEIGISQAVALIDFFNTHGLPGSRAFYWEPQGEARPKR